MNANFLISTLKHALNALDESADSPGVIAAKPEIQKAIDELYKHSDTPLEGSKYAPWQNRVIIEFRELQSKLSALQAFTLSNNFADLEFWTQRDMLNQQFVMEQYCAILNKRIDAFKTGG